MKKIMIIDDEPDIRTYLMAALEDEGYTTCTMDESDPLDKTIMSEKPDLIILDIMMPQRSGISIYKELKIAASLSDIPVVLITGMTPEKDFMEEGYKELIGDTSISLPDGFIEKPIQLPKLMELVDNLLK